MLLTCAKQQKVDRPFLYQRRTFCIDELRQTCIKDGHEKYYASILTISLSAALETHYEEKFVLTHKYLARS